MDILIFDVEGNEQTEAWLHDKWGNVTWTVSEFSLYGTLVLTEDESGSQTTTVDIYDEQGNPIAGREIHCLNGGDVADVTDVTGRADFAWGSGAYYEHGGTGPHAIQTVDVTVAGLGWLRYADGSFSNHYHLNLELREGGDMPTDERAKGFYVSTWQGHIDGATWQAIKNAGYSYVHIRASHGLNKDEYFAANWEGAGAVGLLRSVWHYLVPDLTGQALFFLDIVGDRVPELGHYGDFEEGALTLEKCQSFLTAMENHGIHCNVYTSAGWLNPRGTPDWADRNLWVAHWTTATEPLIPNAWLTWEFWQHTGAEWNEIIGANVCYDRYNGGEADLLAKYLPEPPPDDDDEVRALIVEARAKLLEADNLLVQALALL